MTPPPRLIGAFDSGVGGLSIVAEIRRQLPGEHVEFLADQAWAPYGERTLDAVRARSFAIVDLLLARGASLVVVACNTASAAALIELRARHPGVPFVGMEPAVKPAAEQTGRGVVGVLATTATFQGELYSSVVDRHAVGVTVVPRAGTGLVELIERGVLDGPELDEMLRRHLEPMVAAGIDTLVLGCTHYPFVTEPIRDILGDKVRLIDPAPAVARQVGRVLGGDATTGRQPVPITYLTTGDPDRMSRQIAVLTGDTVIAAHTVI